MAGFFCAFSNRSNSTLTTDEFACGYCSIDSLTSKAYHSMIALKHSGKRLEAISLDGKKLFAFGYFIQCVQLLANILSTKGRHRSLPNYATFVEPRLEKSK